jgi:GGDEF domain-containing protein
MFSLRWRLRAPIDGSPSAIGAVRVPVTIRLGVAHARGGEELELAGLPERTDRALYAAKGGARKGLTVA